MIDTAKYRPQFPASGFTRLEHARGWASDFVAWCNHDHRHSGSRFVSLAQRHAGCDQDVLARRHTLYMSARTANPSRWARHTRNWQPIAAVTLNPERESVVNTAMTMKDEERIGLGRITQAATTLTRTASRASGHGLP
jgi:putative transposase